MPLKKYSTIEERIEARRECQKVYAKKRRDRLREEKIQAGLTKKMGRKPKYDTEEERLAAKRKQIAASVLRLYYRKKEEKETKQHDDFSDEVVEVKE